MAKKWTPEEVLRLGWQFQPACVLAAAADLDLFEAMGEDALAAEEIAKRIHGDLRGARILLDALAALEILEKDGGRYSVPVSLRPFVRPGVPGSVLAMIQHQANCLRGWSRLAEAVRSGEPAPRTPSVRGAEKDREAFIEAMDVINRSAAPDVIGDLMPLEFTHILDVGGGSGTWTIAWLGANPDARGTLFDLPAVVPLADERLTHAGLRDRVELVPGDFYVDDLPTGADLAWISAIVHQNSREQNRELFRKVHAALAPGGRILVRDFVMDEARTSPVGGALFAVNMLALTPRGGTFTMGELAEDLEAVGFEGVEAIRRNETMHSVVSARKAKA